MNYQYCLQSHAMPLADQTPLYNNQYAIMPDEKLNEGRSYLVTSNIPMTNIIYTNPKEQYNYIISNNYSDAGGLKNSYNYKSADIKIKLKDYTKNLASFSSSSSKFQLNQRRKFTPEEDEKLSRIIAQYGPKKWDKVASFMPGRTGRQCRDRFHNYLNPSLTNGPWTREEDRILEQKVLEYGQHWNKIVQFFKGRSDNNVKNRWHTYISRHRQLQNNDISEQNKINNNEKSDDQLCDENYSNDYSENSSDEKNKNLRIENKSLNDLYASNMQTKDNNFQKNPLKNNLDDIINYNNNNLDILPIKSRNGKRIQFPPICPPDESLIMPLNQGMFNFLNHV